MNDRSHDSIARSTPQRAITVLHAGALTNLVQRGLAPAFERETGIGMRIERGHSVALANAIKDGSKTGDLFMSADASVNATLMGAENGALVRWYVAFARNAIVLAYSAKSAHIADFERARSGEIPWYEVLTKPGVRLVRNDPNDDPGGYYALFVCQLAEAHYQIPGLARRILGDATNPAQVGWPDFARLASGDVDAFLAYRTGAIDSGLPYLDLPDAINLGNPAYADTYARAAYTTTAGVTFRGVPIHFTATILAGTEHAEAAARFIAYLLSPDGQALVQAYHFLPSAARVGGDPNAVPAALTPHIEGVWVG